MWRSSENKEIENYLCDILNLRVKTEKISSLNRILASILLVKAGKSKVEFFLKRSLDSIPSPLPSVKIQIMCLRCKGKTLLGVVNTLLKTKSLLTSPSNVLPYYLK